MEIRVLFERNWRYFVFAALAVAILWGLYTYRMTLLPFVVGLLLAYLFSPVVKFIERKLPGRGKWQQAKRIFIIFFILASMLGLMVLAAFLFITTMMNSSSEMINNASQLINNIVSSVKNWVQGLNLPPTIQSQIDAAINSLTSGISGELTGSISGGQSIVTRIVSSLGIVFSFAVLPVFLFYIMMDSEKIQKNIYAELLPGTARHTKNIVHIVECVLGRWVRGELLLGAIVGSMSLAGLLVIGVPFAVPLAVFNGFCEMIPIIGPIIGGVVMTLVALAVIPDKAVWVLGLAVAIQLLENNLFGGGIVSSCLRIHPALILVLLVLGGLFWGFWGLVLTVPLTATLVDIFSYVRSINREANGAQKPDLHELPTPVKTTVNS